MPAEKAVRHVPIGKKSVVGSVMVIVIKTWSCVVSCM